MPIILFMALAAALFAGCDKEATEPQENGNKPLQFEMGIAPQTRAATDAAFKTTWEDGDKIGLYAVRHAAGATAELAVADNYIHNEVLTYSAATQKWTPANPTYSANGDQLDFYAYYPYDAAATDPTHITFNIATDQSAKANYNGSDILFSNTTKNVGSATTSIPLTFAHQLAMVQLSVGKGYNASSVSLLGCSTAATGNLSSGITSNGGAEKQTIKMFRLEQLSDADYTTNYTFRALVPAQTLASGTRMFSIAGDKSFLSGTLTTDVSLSAGKTEIYNFKKIYNVGDYYPDPTNAATAMGVVFWVDPDNATHGKIVSLKVGTNLAWCDWAGNYGATSMSDGRANTDAIAKFIANSSGWKPFPAYQWCVDQGAGWYFPAINELMTLYQQKTVVDAALVGVTSAVQLEGRYWSSTESGDVYGIINIFEGKIVNHSKSLQNNVRAVFAF